jgi:hypothetical protein
VHPVLPLDAACVNQPHVGFVDQGCGLKHMAGRLTHHVLMCKAVEFIMHQGDDLIEGSPVAVTPRLQ